MQSCVLVTKPYPERHTGKNITSSIQRTVGSFEVDMAKVLAVTHDTAANTQCAGELMSVVWLGEYWVCCSQTTISSQWGTWNCYHCPCYCIWEEVSGTLQAQHPCCRTAKGPTGVNGCSLQKIDAGLSHPMGQHLVYGWASVSKQVASVCSCVRWVSYEEAG